MEITRRNYILVDFENTQAIQPESLVGMPVKLVLFTGQGQKSLPVALVKRLLTLGGNAEICESAGNGKNALDFQLCFYAGRIFEREPEAFIHVVSRDKGFDPLIAHLKNLGRACSRVDSFEGLAILKGPASKQVAEKRDPVGMTVGERADFTIKRLSKIQSLSRPRKLRTLKAAVHSYFTKKLSLDEVDRVVRELVRRKVVMEGENEAVSYDLPD